MLEKNIEQQAQQKFFSKKKMLIICLSLILAVALVVLSFIFVLKIDFPLLYEQLTKAFFSTEHIG